MTIVRLLTIDSLKSIPSIPKSTISYRMGEFSTLDRASMAAQRNRPEQRGDGSATCLMLFRPIVDRSVGMNSDLRSFRFWNEPQATRFLVLMTAMVRVVVTFNRPGFL
ncbi:hypothetical protein Poly41_22510 [Novipirellula artificiosorum]|uniref:Uncharacterized protein n=1 Tax=Novipirellula artificiosorum TaxID=2528016 RepID=A0A5C6DU42_9BACT|nr:hypothetical protein Poly41_22510 [Novipirellula artificiosorum]